MYIKPVQTMVRDALINMGQDFFLELIETEETVVFRYTISIRLGVLACYARVRSPTKTNKPYNDLVE